MSERDDENVNLEGEKVEIDHRDDRGAAEREVAERHKDPDREPHHQLNHPAENPDPTADLDPYDRRPDADEVAGDGEAEDDEGEATTGEHAE